MDVQRRWLCVLVTSYSDVMHSVDISVLQGVLQIIFKINENFNLFNFSGNCLPNLCVYINQYCDKYNFIVYCVNFNVLSAMLGGQYKSQT